MKFTTKIFLVPAVAFILNLITVAILGSFLGVNELKELLGGNNSTPIFAGWCVVLLFALLVQKVREWQKT